MTSEPSTMTEILHDGGAQPGPSLAEIEASLRAERFQIHTAGRHVGTTSDPERAATFRASGYDVAPLTDQEAAVVDLKSQIVNLRAEVKMWRDRALAAEQMRDEARRTRDDMVSLARVAAEKLAAFQDLERAARAYLGDVPFWSDLLSAIERVRGPSDGNTSTGEG